MAKSEKREIQPQEIRVLVPENLRAGVYANTIQVTASHEEVTLNFIYINPHDDPKGTLVSRVTVTNKHARQISEQIKSVLDTELEVNGE